MKQLTIFFQLLIAMVLLNGCHASPDEDKKKSLESLFKNSHFKELTGGENNWQIKENNPETVDIADGRGISLNMSQLVDSLYYVKLETKADNIIGHIDKLYQSSDKIVVVDKRMAKEVFIFDNHGTFLSKISRLGPGPQEYNELSDVSADFIKNEIGILDFTKLKLLTYDYSGKFLRAAPIPILVQSLEYLPGKAIVWFNKNMVNAHIPTLADYSLFLTDTSMRVLKKAFEFPSGDSPQESPYNYWNLKPLYRSDKTLYYNPRLSTFIFKVDSAAINPLYYLNLHGMGFSPKEMETMTNNIYQKRVGDENFFLFNGEYAVNNNAFYCRIYNRKEMFGCFYNNKTKKSTSFSGIVTDRPDAILFNFPYTSYQNFFISPLYAHKIVETKKDLKVFKKNKELVNLYESVKADDNPILMYYSLR